MGLERGLVEMSAELEVQHRSCESERVDSSVQWASRATSREAAPQFTSRPYAAGESAADSLARILDEHPEPVLVVSELGYASYANKSACELRHSTTNGDVLVPSLLELARRAATSSEPLQADCAVFERTFAVVARPAAGGVTLYLHDITDQRLVETLAIEYARLFNEMEERERGLRDADRRKNEFLATVSHELRNPLAPIINSLFVVERTAPGSSQSQRAITVIERQVALLANLVNDLLDVTRVANGKLNLQRRRLDLNELVRRTVEDTRPVFEQAGVHLELRQSPSVVPVHGDATRLGQVFANLLQNAAKFTPFGGHTWVSVDADANSVAIRIRDSGVGIEHDALGRVFEPFMQAPPALEKSKGGLGLGLPIAKGLVELHDGTISAASEGLGQGAEFAVVLPLDSGGRAPSQPPPDCPDSVETRRILIIEDNVDAADTLRDVLELGHHVVDVAYFGKEGLAKARAFGPQVVLCDIGLPDMDGHEVARCLRRDPRFMGCSLIALTGHALPEDAARARAAGFDCHLAKPLAPAELEKALAQVARH